MSQYRIILIYGFAIFAMFFGSGNLVFPIQIGQNAGHQWFLGFLGLFATGIILPFLGLFVIKLHRGNYHNFFAEAGRPANIILPLFILSLLGSFGVIPRCITVAHGGMSYIFPEISLIAFSAIFCITTFFFCLQDQNVINIIGKWLSPVLVLALAALIAIGIMNASPLEEVANITPTGGFYDGFLTGYQTMDLFAAFFFSSLTFAQIQKTMPAKSTSADTTRLAIKPSILGAMLLALIYLGLVFLGAHFASITEGVEPEFLLPTIAKHVMGEGATIIIGVTMLVSCLTTAIALNNLYARYLCDLFKLKQKSFAYILAGTTIISYVISLFDFNGIANFLVPALQISYPSIIALTILGIITRKYHRLKMVLFYAILIAVGLWNYVI